MEDRKILKGIQISKFIRSAGSGSAKFQNLMVVFAIIMFAVILRILPHPPNVAPIAAIALFGGFYLDKRLAIIVPLIALFISDILIGIHIIMPFVYLSFILTALIGIHFKNRKSIKSVLVSTLFASSVFFFITNLGVFLVGNLYPHTLEGLINCYYMAVPFFRNTLVGDLLFVGLFFGSFELAIKLLKRFQHVYIY
jgi:hypothetical protein